MKTASLAVSFLSSHGYKAPVALETASTRFEAVQVLNKELNEVEEAVTHYTRCRNDAGSGRRNRLAARNNRHFAHLLTEAIELL